MNYLAHLALAPDSPAARVGNLLGDFVKGTESSLRLQMPADLVDGIVLHRALDKFTDTHPAFLKSKMLLSPGRRRYAGVVVDVIYDHFLSNHWHDFYQPKLDDFIAEFYAVLEEKKEWQLGTLREAFPWMKKQNWLACYKSKEGVELTFRRVAQRSRFTVAIADTYLDFREHYHEFEKHFLEIYPDLIDFSAKYDLNKINNDDE